MSLKSKRPTAAKGKLNKPGTTKSRGGQGSAPRSQKTKYKYTKAQLYLKYTMLESGHLGHIFSSLEEIKNDVRLAIENKIGRKFEKHPVLYIDSLYTGKSITINLAGTTFTIDAKKKHVVAFLVIVSLYSAFKAYNEYRLTAAQTEQTLLENDEKKIDIELKRLQLEKAKTAWEKEKDSAAGKLTLYLSNNKKITAVHINKKRVK